MDEKSIKLYHPLRNLDIRLLCEAYSEYLDISVTILKSDLDASLIDIKSRYLI